MDAAAGKPTADVTVFVSAMRLRAFIGVDPQEQVVGNDFEVSVEVDVPAAVAAGVSDCLADTVSYADVAGVVKRVMSSKMELVEHAAAAIVKEIAARWSGVTSVRVMVAKLAPPVAGVECRSMGVTFRWSR